MNNSFLCRLRSIAARRDHFVCHLSVRPSLLLSGSHAFLVVMHSYVSQATHAFLGMLPLCCIADTVLTCFLQMWFTLSTMAKVKRLFIRKLSVGILLMFTMTGCTYYGGKVMSVVISPVSR